MSPRDDERIKWCCRTLRDSVSESGRRGLAIFLNDVGDPAFFVIQFRAIEPGAPDPESESPLTLGVETGIRFCPWCGTNLLRFYRKHLKALARPEFVMPLE